MFTMEVFSDGNSFKETSDPGASILPVIDLLDLSVCEFTTSWFGKFWICSQLRDQKLKKESEHGFQISPLNLFPNP